MRPVIDGEIRTLFSPLDFAAMDDIGWEVVNTSATVTASHRYLDDGNFTPVVLLEGSSLGRLTKTGAAVSVTNVSPTLTVAGNQTVTLGEAVSISEIGSFTDPGNEQTYSFTIDWGDGTSDDGSATIEQRATASGVESAGAFGGSHTYTEAGSKTVTVRIQDNDGGFDQETLTINVLAPPSLSLEISQSRISEDDDVDAAILTVRRSGAAANVDTVVSLSSDDTTEATLPDSVTIPAGQTTATVSIKAIDDDLLDGDQTVTLSASGAGVASSTAQLIVGDAESLSATVTSDMVAEQNAGAAFLVLARSNTDVDEAITVNIAGIDRSQLDLASSVQIAAGQREVRVPIVPVDDNVAELTFAVSLTVSAVFYGSDSVDFEILDNEPPKFQNPVSRHDVNDMDGVTALDALRVINRLAIQTTPQLDPSTTEPNGVFLDVNGDYQVTALDALQVINQLARVGDNSGDNSGNNAGGESLATEAVDLVLRSPAFQPIQWIDVAVDGDDDTDIEDRIAFEPISALI
ncbi:MAG: dockerin type I domain-containing protein [Rubripirellula sp.]